MASDGSPKVWWPERIIDPEESAQLTVDRLGMGREFLEDDDMEMLAGQMIANAKELMDVPPTIKIRRASLDRGITRCEPCGLSGDRVLELERLTAASTDAPVVRVCAVRGIAEDRKETRLGYHLRDTSRCVLVVHVRGTGLADRGCSLRSAMKTWGCLRR